MDYEEKSELKKEITTTAKRSIKTCVILGIVIVIIEIVLLAGIMRALAVSVTGFEVFLWAYLYSVVRYGQLGLINYFNAE